MADADVDDYLKWIIDLERSLHGLHGLRRMFGSGMREDLGLREALLRDADLHRFDHAPDGSPDLVEQIQRRYDVSQVPVLAEGASAALLLVTLATLRAGDVALVETPGYAPQAGACVSAGASVSYFRRRRDGWGVDLDGLRAAAEVNPRTKLVVLSNPHNPSGALLDATALADVADAVTAVCPRAKVVVDEAFLDLVPPSMRPRPAATVDDRLISVSSLTKPYGLGWLRCGWALATDTDADTRADPDKRPLSERLARARRFDHQFGSDLLQRLAVRAFQRLDEFAAKARATLDQNERAVREFITPLLAKGLLTGHLPAFGGLCFLGTPDGADATGLVDRLRARRVVVAPGDKFGLPTHFRVTYGGHPDSVRAGLKDLADVVGQGQPRRE